MKNKKNKGHKGQKEFNNSQIDVERKTEIIKVILNDVYEILTLFKPLLSTMIQREEAQKFKKDGTFSEAARLFGNIAKNSKELEVLSAQDFLNITN